MAEVSLMRPNDIRAPIRYEYRRGWPAMERRRLARRAKTVGRGALRHLGCIVTPETLLRWYRELVAKKYDGSKRRRVGRPTKPDELRILVVTLARENCTWGSTGIGNARRTLGHQIGRTTIQSTLQEQGIDLAPNRRRELSWHEFLLQRPYQCSHGRFVVEPANENSRGPIQGGHRLGGLLRYYHRDTA